MAKHEVDLSASEPRPNLLEERWASARWVCWAGLGLTALIVAARAVRPGWFASDAWEPVPGTACLMACGLVGVLWFSRPSVLRRLRERAPVWRDLLKVVPVALGLGVLAWAFIAAAGFGANPTRAMPLACLPMVAWISVVLAVMVVVLLRRQGSARYCPKCGYVFGYADEATAPQACSECGLAWREKLMTGRARKIQKVWALGVWLTLAPAAILGMIAAIKWDAWMPEAIVFREMRLSSSSGAWLGREVARSTSIERLRAAADAAIGRRERGEGWGYAIHAVHDWAKAGKLSDEQTERLRAIELSTLVAAQTIAPGATPGGTGDQAPVAGHVRLTWDGGRVSYPDDRKPYFAVASARIGDGPKVLIRGAAISAYRLRDSTGVDAARTVAIPGLPGAMQGREVVLEVYRLEARGIVRGLEWSDSGEPLPHPQVTGQTLVTVRVGPVVVP